MLRNFAAETNESEAHLRQPIYPDHQHGTTQQQTSHWFTLENWGAEKSNYSELKAVPS